MSTFEIEQPDDRNTQNVHIQCNYNDLSIQFLRIQNINFNIDLTNDPPNATMPLSTARPRSSTCLCPAAKPSACRHTTRTGPDQGRIGGSGAQGLAGSGDGVLGEGDTDFIGDDEEDFRSGGVRATHR
jgi:hypothetical protein